MYPDQDYKDSSEFDDFMAHMNDCIDIEVPDMVQEAVADAHSECAEEIGNTLEAMYDECPFWGDNFCQCNVR